MFAKFVSIQMQFVDYSSIYQQTEIAMSTALIL